MAKKRDTMGMVARILLIIGGLNWGLAIFDINLVTMLSFGMVMISNLIYGLVAIAAIMELIKMFK